MARRPRLHIPGAAHHIIQRGNNRQACFGDESDYKAYLTYLKESAEKHEVAIHAYVLMTNHVHLLCTPKTDQGNSRMMQTVGRRYVQFFNHKYARTGTLWEGRYKSTLVQTETYLLSVYRYIELNPVRAQMVEHASEYPWSSYRSNGVGLNIDLITPHNEYLRLGEDAQRRHQAYRELFTHHMSKKTREEICDCTNKSWVLGDDRFKLEVESQTGMRAERSQRGGDRKSLKYRESRNQ